MVGNGWDADANQRGRNVGTDREASMTHSAHADAAARICVRRPAKAHHRTAPAEWRMSRSAARPRLLRPLASWGVCARPARPETAFAEDRMPSTSKHRLFAAAALPMAVTPGPNMVYLISRSICQGRTAGFMSWLGVVPGFSVHMVSAAVGLGVLLLAVPLAYEVLEFAGAMDLLWLAWQAVRPGARSAFEARALRAESPRKLFTMGLLTSVLNPKVAVFYLSVLPQIITAQAGSVLVQSLVLGSTQVCIGAAVNLLVTLSAAQVALRFARNRLWLAVQRYAMGLVLGALAFKLLGQQRGAG
jgi:threonine/homoserine/homoserine lactone efflux protein